MNIGDGAVSKVVWKTTQDIHERKAKIWDTWPIHVSILMNTIRIFKRVCEVFSVNQIGVVGSKLFYHATLVDI